MHMWRRTSSMFTCGAVMHCPSKTISPEVGTSSRFRQRRKVDLPEPEGPMTTTFSPGAMCSLTPLSTTWSP